MIVDAHHHLWRADLGWLQGTPELAPLRRDYTVDDLRQRLTAAGVDHTVLVEADRGDAGETEWFCDIAAATPEIAGVVGWIRLSDPDLDAVLARYAAHPGAGYLVGLRDQVQARDLDYLDRPEVLAGLRRIADTGFVFDLIVRSEQLPSAARAATAIGNARLVLDHLGKPPIRDGLAGLARWRPGIAALASCPNVVAKLSGLVTEADPGGWTADDLRPFVETAWELFGPQRLMFGSDWPVCELAADYPTVLDTLTDLIGGPHEAILATTAVDTYRLDIRADGATAGP